MTSKPACLIPPPAFVRAVRAVTEARWRREITVEEIPSPRTIAPFAHAIAADVDIHGEEVGNGRLVLLHNPDGDDTWGGDFRCVTYAKAEVDPEMVTDPLLTDVGWSWFLDALDAHGARHTAAAGTVTAVSSKPFGGKEDEPPHAEIEIRASWTPLLEPDGSGLEGHVAAWGELLCMTAGMPPLPEGVAVLAGPMGRRR